MRLQMQRVDHDAFGLWAVAREGREDAVEDAKPAPPDEAVVKRLVTHNPWARPSIGDRCGSHRQRR